MAQLVDHPNLDFDSGYVLKVLRLSPASLFLFLCPSPTTHALSLFQKQKQKLSAGLGYVKLLISEPIITWGQTRSFPKPLASPLQGGNNVERIRYVSAPESRTVPGIQEGYREPHKTGLMQESPPGKEGLELQPS